MVSVMEVVQKQWLGVSGNGYLSILTKRVSNLVSCVLRECDLTLSFDLAVPCLLIPSQHSGHGEEGESMSTANKVNSSHVILRYIGEFNLTSFCCLGM